MDTRFNSLTIARRASISRTLLASAGLTAIALTTVACGSPVAGAAGQPAAMASQAQPGQIAINCGVGQQPLIRPSVVNGQPVSQVECVATSTAVTPIAQPVMTPGTASMPSAPAAGYAQPQPAYAQPAYPQAQPVYPQPIAYAPAQPQPVAVATSAPVYEEVRPVTTRRVVRTNDDYVQYRPARRVKSGRTWQKSAVIIGSSAGIGAGIGAATGGKKGALIGAAIGGGASAIWDQVTRDKQR